MINNHKCLYFLFNQYCTYFTGVGKTSLTHLICENQSMNNPSWTVGCSIAVKLHEFKEGTPNQKRYFIEFWDIGGSQSHQNTRHVFYNPTNGNLFTF